MHVPVPVHAPVQPENDEPVLAFAVRVTVVLALYVAEHVLPQLIPPGVLVIVPDPVFETLSV